MKKGPKAPSRETAKNELLVADEKSHFITVTKRRAFQITELFFDFKARGF
ncbi:hypothetical protein [Vibrio furnissii]